jgi:hypothetical protein
MWTRWGGTYLWGLGGGTCRVFSGTRRCPNYHYSAVLCLNVGVLRRQQTYARLPSLRRMAVAFSASISSSSSA